MPGKESLLKLLKRNPPTDTRNLIEPTADFRYLAMKLRAGHTKPLFELLDASDNTYFEVDPAGRYVLFNKRTGSDWVALFLKSGGTDEDLQAAIDEIANGEDLAIYLPGGVWTCDTDLDLSTNKHLSIFGAGRSVTTISYAPASPTTNPLIDFPRSLNRVENIAFDANADLTAGSLLKFSSQNNRVACCLINVNSDNDQDGLKFDNDFNHIIDTEITARHYCIEFNGQSTRQIIERCILEGTGLANSVGIRHDSPTSQPLKLFTNNNFIKTVDFGIQIGAGDAMLNSRVNNNTFESDIGTRHIDHPLTNDVYLIHGNTFLGAATFDIPAGVKQRDNIGLADAN